MYVCDICKNKYPENEEEYRKPLGLMPEKIHEEKRISELSRAIYEYADVLSIENNIDILIEWTDELSRRLDNYAKNHKAR